MPADGENRKHLQQQWLNCSVIRTRKTEITDVTARHSKLRVASAVGMQGLPTNEQAWSIAHDVQWQQKGRETSDHCKWPLNSRHDGSGESETLGVRTRLIGQEKHNNRFVTSRPQLSLWCHAVLTEASKFNHLDFVRLRTSRRKPRKTIIHESSWMKHTLIKSQISSNYWKVVSWARFAIGNARIFFWPWFSRDHSQTFVLIVCSA